eukprot:CAMPEP_0197055188 /NCGR_PEP_ID=MMETSP1384-20130603/59247_1 /TAXON_ID=29189 /ORGANISM="Ammonia sp." /LENGTH=199 /DNA_ID=CAMNT_0042488675 /DNA_START=22 /DNA_END=621 /DNA_ORIENTATION=-
MSRPKKGGKKDPKGHRRVMTLINDDQYLDHPLCKTWKNPAKDTIDLVFAHSPPTNRGNLFLTSILALKGPQGLEAIKSRNVTRIVSMGVDCGVEQPTLKESVLFVNIEDTVDAMNDLDKNLNKAYDWIHGELSNPNGGSVLVHCRQGISRSVSVVCYYLMRRYQITAIMALARVKKSRQKADPNKGFFKVLQLRDPKEI